VQKLILLAQISPVKMRAIEAALIASLVTLMLLTLFPVTTSVLADVIIIPPETSFNLTVPIMGQIIGPDNQPLRNVTLYLVADRNDTTRAIAVNVTNNDGQFLLTYYQFVANADEYPEWIYWLVSKEPIFYSVHTVAVDLTCAWESGEWVCYRIYYVASIHYSVSSESRYYNLRAYVNGTVFYLEMAPYNLSDVTRGMEPADFLRPTDIRCYLGNRLVNSVTGNVTIKIISLPFWVTIVGVPLTNSLYFYHFNYFSIIGQYAILRIPETVAEGGTTYRLSNVTIRYDSGESVSYSGGNLYAITSDVSDVNIYYEPVSASGSTTTTTTTTTAPGGTTQTLSATWIIVGILVAATASLLALSRGRKAAMAVMRGRRALRSAP